MWQDYRSLVSHHSVVGDLRIRQSVYSPQLDSERDVLVWLPPSYQTSHKRYPVIYMHDGQNLFDAYTSNSGEWGVDETMTTLSAEGIEAIVVGLPNQGDRRRIEYNPYPIPNSEFYREAVGDAYIRFITDTLKPLIDADFRTRPEASMTGIAGSSMGGLISLHGYLTCQDVFGFCGTFSPVWWIGTGLQQTIQNDAQGRGKIYLDIGGKEGEVIVSFVQHLTTNLDTGHQVYLQGVRQVQAGLLDKGYRLYESLLYVEDAEAIHHESAWAKRLPDALRFLIPH